MTVQRDAPRPYLSIVLTGRNDGYGGDFVTRFLATLQVNHRELTARGVSHEIVLVEWDELSLQGLSPWNSDIQFPLW